MKRKRITKKTWVIVSGICLLISSILFSSTPFVYDKKIDALKIKMNDSSHIAQFNWGEMTRARNEFLLGSQKSTDNKIFILLEADEKVLQENLEAALFHLSSSVDILATISKGAILTKEERNYIFSITTLTEKISLYRTYFEKAMDRYNKLNASVIDSKTQILNFEKRKNSIWIIAILFQFIGLIIGIGISAKKEKS